MRSPRALGTGLALIGLTSLLACSSAAPARTGSERAHCYPNQTCDEGLTCLSTFCVRVVDDAGTTTSDAPLDNRESGAGGDVDAPPSSEAGSGGAAGGAAGADAGAEVSATGGTFVPAPHPTPPQVVSLGGPVLSTPKIQPILYSGDTRLTDVQAFLNELAHTTYWNETTSEYGVGPLVILPSITLPGSPIPGLTDTMLRQQIVDNTSGQFPIWKAPDPNVIYLFVIPDGSTVVNAGSTCCSDFGGYHDEVMSGSTTVPYAVGCACPGFLGFTITGFDERTTAISHELIEAATDPFVRSNPAYQTADRSDAIWSAVTGGEVGDMCAFNDDAAFVPPGGTFMVQRTWSNQAAKSLQNPCVPHAASTPYFNAFPALESVAWGSSTYITRGLSIPLLTPRTIDVQLYSSGRTKGPWTVSAVDYDSWVLGAAPKLDLTLDKNEGVNGDVLRLTIKPLSADKDLLGEGFLLISHSGGVRDPDYQTNISMGLVTNP